ncbi:MAG: Na+/H+ antiporter subunit D [Planctomycetes bacterium]|jgi:multicomponent Na+:H+ antiporter subunit D|nr:Na+/H+ antiporter subunit D [Planctomycetota bacterium]
MTVLLVLPILLPLLGAAASLLAWRSVAWQRAMLLAGTGGLFLSAGALLVTIDHVEMLHTQMGGWPAPFGITLAADRLSAIMVALAGTMGLIVGLTSFSEDTRRRSRRGFVPLLLVLLAGVCGAFLTGDLFNLYVWFEVLLIASFVLLSLGNGRAQMEASVKYLTLSLLGSMLLLIGVGVIYGTARTLNLADLHLALGQVRQENPALVLGLAAILAVAFSLKAALFPLFFWLPASYHVPSAGVCAIFAALLTKVGVYALLRAFTLLFTDMPGVLAVVLVVASITMISGVLGAVTQYEFKRILAWHSISQVGYIVVGLGLLAVPDPRVQALGLAATIVFLIHHGMIKPALFLVAGRVDRRTGTTQLKPLGGMALSTPLLTALFLLPALSLAGLPPSTGFWAKLAVVRSVIAAEHWWVLAAALGAGVLTLLSMMKIWNEVFWKPRPDSADSPAPTAGGPPSHRRDAMGLAALILLVGLVTLLGLWPQPLLRYADNAADQLLTPSAYVEAIGVHRRPPAPTPDAAAVLNPEPDP